jgi:hypothetical protein
MLSLIMIKTKRGTFCSTNVQLKFNKKKTNKICFFKCTSFNIDFQQFNVTSLPNHSKPKMGQYLSANDKDIYACF